MGDTNPIVSYLRNDREEVEKYYTEYNLSKVVESANGHFHKYLKSLLMNQHQSLSIYLVDDAVIDALGLFQSDGKIPVHAPDVVRHLPPHSGEDDQLKSVFEASIRLRSAADRVCRITKLFGAINVTAELSLLQKTVGALYKRCKRVKSRRQGLEKFSSEELGSEGELREKLYKIVDELERIFANGFSLLHGRNGLLPSQYIDDNLLNKKILPILEEIRLACREWRCMNYSTAAILGIDTDRSLGGVLLADLPIDKDTTIEAPAVLIAPRAIIDWAKGWIKLPISLSDKQRNDFAIENVVAHELTHAMLTLSKKNPSPQEAAAKWKLYSDIPGLEEGMANFVAALISMDSDVVKKTKYRNGDYPKALKELALLTYKGYHDEETDLFMDNWEKRNYDLHALAHIFWVFSVDIERYDWKQFLIDLRAGSVNVSPIDQEK